MTTNFDGLFTPPGRRRRSMPDPSTSRLRRCAQDKVFLHIIAVMRSAKQTLDETFLEMRWRCLSLAADLDRVERAAGGEAAMESDARLKSLSEAIAILLQDGPNRAERVQNIFSDKTPAPQRV